MRGIVPLEAITIGARGGPLRLNGVGGQHVIKSPTQALKDCCGVEVNESMRTDLSIK